jgi:protein SCO1
MKRALLPLLLAGLPAQAQLAPADLAQAKAVPTVGLRLPGALAFRDARDGRLRRLGDVVAGRPALLVFADFTCKHICGPGLMLTGAALARTGLAPGSYALVVIGLDPRDPAEAARATLARVPRATVLSGDAATVRAATRRLGYRYAFDSATDQFAHDASLYVFGRDGRLATLLPELGVTPAALEAALAGKPEPAGVFDRVAHLCYGFAAAHGRYGQAIVTALQLLSAAGLIAAGAWFLRRRSA